MKRLQLLSAIALVLAATPVFAQPDVELCDAPWMDAERVQALLAVEFGGWSEASQVTVLSCTDDAAEVAVRFGADDAATRASQLDLRATATDARSRLVALVIAELVRLGPPRVAPTDAIESTLDLSVENSLVETPDTTTEDSVIAATAADAAAETVAQSAVDPETTEPETSAEEAAAQALEDAAEPDRCAGWRRFGRGPCSWAISFSYGAAFHQLGLVGEERQGKLGLHQIRLIGRWRYLIAGFRVFGAGMNIAPPSADLRAGGWSAFAGLEWWARRWSQTVVAMRTSIELGLHGFDGFDGPGVCGFDCPSSGQPLVGAVVSARVERAFGIVRGGVELELGYSTGFRIDQASQLVTGLGGPWASINLDISIGKSE